MANFSDVILWILKQEDSTLSGRVVDLGDGQGLTRYGIAQHSQTALPPDFYVAAPATALTYAKVVYRGEYWDAILGDEILDTSLAATLMSYAVNDGVSRAVKILQGLLGLMQDGEFGAQTLMAVNAANAVTLATELREAQAAWYRTVVANNPADARFLDGWLARAARIYPN